MSEDDNLAIAGSVWDSLSTGKKWALLIAAIGVVVTAFGGGFWFGRNLGENKIAALQAKHEREITELRGKMPGSISHELKLGFVPPDDGLPILSKAEENQLSMADVQKLEYQFKTDAKDKTSINRPRFFEQYVAQRFTWSGYVSDVHKHVYDRQPYFAVSMRLDRDELYSFSATCYFVGDVYEEMAKDLKQDEQITVTGVMNSDGNLTKCKFIRIGAHSPSRAE